MLLTYKLDVLPSIEKPNVWNDSIVSPHQVSNIRKKQLNCNKCGVVPKYPKIEYPKNGNGESSFSQIPWNSYEVG